MKIKLRNMEKKFYEIIGIKIFRKMAFFFRKLLYCLKIKSKEEREKVLSEASNYNMKKGNGIQDLRDFKSELKFNAHIHLIGFILCIVGFVLSSTPPVFVASQVFMSVFMILNAYCVMLQRYNLIRIHEAEEKYEKLQVLKNKRAKRLAKQREKELSRQRINELINLLNRGTITNNESLKEMGYRKVIDARTYFGGLDDNDPLNPNYWLNTNKPKSLTRKVS